MAPVQSAPTLDIFIHDDHTADVLTPHGRVVESLTANADEVNLGEVVGDYVAEQARLLNSAVLVRTTRDGSDDTLLLVGPDRQATRMILTDAGTAVPATDIDASPEPAEDIGDEVVDNAMDDAAEDFTAPAIAYSEAPIMDGPAPGVDDLTPAPPPPVRGATPSAPIQVPTGGSTPPTTAVHDESPAVTDGYDDTTPFRTPPPSARTAAGTRGPGRRGPGPHVPRPSATPHIPDTRGRLATVWHRHRAPILVIAAAVVAVVVGIGVLMGHFVGGASTQDTPPADPAVAMATPADPTSDAVECPSRTEGARTTGRDPGDQTSGPSVIKAFNYAYFRWRSGTAARAMASSNARIGNPIELQSSIDALNPQARYCLAITDKGNSVYGVELTLILPDGTRDPKPDVQQITTTTIGGKTYIAALTRTRNP